MSEATETLALRVGANADLIPVAPACLRVAGGRWLIEDTATRMDLHEAAMFHARLDASAADLKYQILEAAERLYGAKFARELALQHAYYRSEQSANNALRDIRQTVEARAKARELGLSLTTSELRSLATVTPASAVEIVEQVARGEVPRQALRAEAANTDVSTQSANDALMAIQAGFEFLAGAGHIDTLAKAINVADQYRDKVITK